TLPASTAGLPGAGLPWAIEGGGATLAARIGLPADGAPGAAEEGGGTLVAVTTGLPAPGPPGAAEDGTGVTLVAGTTGSLAAAPAGAVEGSAALAPRIGFAGAGAPGAADGTCGTMGAGTTGSPAARSPGAVEDGGAILVARTLGLRTAVPPRALEGAGVTVVAATTELPGAGAPGGVGGGGGGIIAAGNIGLAGAGGGGINAVASSAGSSGAGPAGGVGPFRRRSGIAAGFATGGATLPSTPGFELCGISFRRRLGMGAAARGAFVFPCRGAAFLMSSGGNGLPRRGTPRGSSQIHFTAPLPPSVRMKFFFPRRCISSITQRFEKPVSLARRAISIWRPPRLADSGLGDASNRINARHKVASAGSMTFNSHWRSTSPSMLAGLDQSIGLRLVRLTGAGPETFQEIWSFDMQQGRSFFPPPPACALLRMRRPHRQFSLDGWGR